MLHACTHAQAHCTHTARTLHAQDTLDSPDHTEHPLALHVEARIIAYEAAFDRIVSLSGHYSRSMIDGFHAFCKSQSGEQVNDKKLASCINQHAVMFRRFEFDKIQGHTESRTGSRTGLWPLASTRGLQYLHQGPHKRAEAMGAAQDPVWRPQHPDRKPGLIPAGWAGPTNPPSDETPAGLNAQRITGA